METALCFDDVLLVPGYSEIASRKSIDLHIDLDQNIRLDIPIISAPMDTVTEENMVSVMSKLGGLGIIHRYNTVEEQCDIVQKALQLGAKHIGAAIGVSEDDQLRAIKLLDAGADVLCIDVAHAHHISVYNTLRKLRRKLGKEYHIMVGNVATLGAVNALSDLGASSIKIGIGGGSICSTRIQTGHGMPTLQSVIDCSKTDRDVVLIADGGIRNSGDICKSLSAGAGACMLGSLLASTASAPGDVFVNRDNKSYKVYRGMASSDAQMNWRGFVSSQEGISTTIPYAGPTEQIVNDLLVGTRSGLSYSGARDIHEFQLMSRMIKITGAGMEESRTHILNRK